MGMIGNLLRASKTKLENYIKDSATLEDDIYNENAPLDVTIIDIDKAWDGIVFLLTGDSALNSPKHPFYKILFSGQIIDNDQDLGYGPAHYLTPEQVIEFSNKISEITTDDLRQKYDPQKMQKLEVYPEIWERDVDEAFDYLNEYFKDIQQFYSDAAKNKEAIVTYIN
ncbi:YfbM family protein [Flavobacterium sp. N502540]|uniref:YfbM family protein n=1 Tax=Flavobacterium sp. N502540 TaxID=2986838 RepID=UPI002224F726|nr:YfbM family protein [Flavobacterium sp. N502540]